MEFDPAHMNLFINILAKLVECFRRSGKVKDDVLRAAIAEAIVPIQEELTLAIGAQLDKKVKQAIVDLRDELASQIQEKTAPAQESTRGYIQRLLVNRLEASYSLPASGVSEPHPQWHPAEPPPAGVHRRHDG